MSYTKLAATGVLALLMSSGAVMADTWRYAFEEALEEVQGKFAQKFKEEVEANSDHSVQLFPFGTLGESDSILEQTQSGILQFVDQSRQRVDAQLAALELARNVQRELEHRIEQRSFLRLAVEHAQAFAQTRGDRIQFAGRPATGRQSRRVPPARQAASHGPCRVFGTGHQGGGDVLFQAARIPRVRPLCRRQRRISSLRQAERPPQSVFYSFQAGESGLSPRRF